MNPAPAPEIAALIARGRYAPAIEMLRERLQRERHNAPTRMQLADVLVLAGRGVEAVPVLLDLADEFAADGFATKAIAILKKIEKIDPNRFDVDKRLSALLQTSRKMAEPAWVMPARLPAGAVDIPERPIAGSGQMYEMTEARFKDAGAAPAADAGTSVRETPPAALSSWPPPQPHAADGRHAAPEELYPEPVFSADAEPEEAGLEPQAQIPVRPAPVAPRASVPPRVAAPSASVTHASVEPEDEDDGDEVPILELHPEDDPEPEIVLEPDDVLPLDQRREIPLFNSLADDEALALIKGLKLITFEAGDPILTQGDDPGSMFILTQGRVKTFIKEPGGRRHIMVRTLGEGEFFGEIAVLTGKPRTATVTAATRCDVLELDAATLESLTKQHPRIREVLEEFFIERVSTQAERLAQGSRPGQTEGDA